MAPQKLLRIWLIGLAVGITFMIVVGGYTRLTHAGLSLVDWKPVVGAIPPLTNEDWQTEWVRYQQFPEFQKGVVKDFPLFQKLFWIEYAHRLLGRLVGLWLLLGLAYVFITPNPGWLRRKICWWAVAIAFQGWLGWYMVQSGLVNDPQVSPYRLTAHFWVALALLTSVMRTYLKLSMQRNTLNIPKLNYFAHTLVGLTLTWGCLVAGHKAGLIYNTFPLMEGIFMPSDAWFYSPWITNIGANPTCVQMIHRYLAYTTLTCITLSFLKSPHRHTAIWLVLALIQATLGVITLLTHVNIHAALLHQACGVFLWLWGVGVAYPLRTSYS